MAGMSFGMGGGDLNKLRLFTAMTSPSDAPNAPTVTTSTAPAAYKQETQVASSAPVKRHINTNTLG
jgi:hypothetical protein